MCRAYVQAIAARCGLSVSVPAPDYGIDLTLNDIVVSGRQRAESGYKLDVQAKSTTVASLAGTFVRYDLDVRAYETLRRAPVGTPRILVLLVLPEQERLWSSQTEEELVLRHCTYWASLKGHRSVSNRRSVRLTIPRASVFSVAVLQELMRKVKTGEEL
jgi:hypothetical protein